MDALQYFICVGFNDTSTHVCHFVSSPRQREKRKETKEILEKMEERDREKEENE